MIIMILTKKIIIFFLSFAYTPIALILYLFKIKILKLNVKRIGHLVLDTFYALNINENYKFLILTKKKKVANKYLKKILKNSRLNIIENNFLYYFFLPLSYNFFSTFDASVSSEIINGQAGYIKVLSKQNVNLNYINIPTQDLFNGFEILKNLGITKNEWFVCILFRDSNYSGGYSSDYDQQYRNTNLNSFSGAIDFINSKGGKCILMGDSSSANPPKSLDIIDYSHSEYKSDFMDIFLCANCKFFLGTYSGLSLVSALSNIPIAVTDVVPLSHILIWSEKDISIPKLYKRNDKYIKFDEIFNSNLSNFRFNSKFEENNIKLIDNSIDEILNLCIEMFNKVEGNLKSVTLLQNEFKKKINPNHYTYEGKSQISKYFINKHKNLM